MKYCRNCGAKVDEQAVICVGCGVRLYSGKQFCQHCGAATNPSSEQCLSCGVDLAKEIPAESAKSKMVAGLLGILLGGLGIHNFYLGQNTLGIIHASLFGVGFLTIWFCGVGFIPLLATSIWGLVEGIMIMTGKVTKDAEGNLLKD